MGKEAQMSSGNEPGANTTGWPFSRPAHALSHEEVVRELTCDGKNGLSKTEAPSRLQRCGRNELGQAPGVQPVKIFIRQIANAMTMVCFLYSPRPSVTHSDRAARAGISEPTLTCWCYRPLGSYSGYGC